MHPVLILIYGAQATDMSWEVQLLEEIRRSGLKPWAIFGNCALIGKEVMTSEVFYVQFFTTFLIFLESVRIRWEQ